MLRRLIMAAALAACAVTPALAQEEEGEEIVVTGSRYRERYEDFVVPHVAVVRRADAAAMELTVSSDTRDAAARRAELNQALRNLASRAGGAVTLGILDEDGDDDDGETRLRPFSVELAMDLLRAGSRPDTSQITILTRTPIRPNDTLDSVEERLDGFRASMARPGRVEAWGGDLNLIVIDPPQYRGEIISAITTDAGRISTALGSAYGARLEGLENPIAWKRAGDLELRLFIPYRMIILPRDGAS
jgi:hypothetical protein